MAKQIFDSASYFFFPCTSAAIPLAGRSALSRMKPVARPGCGPHGRDRFGFHHGNQQTPVLPFWQGQSQMATKIPLLIGAEWWGEELV
jgi:hypothetical protein